MTIPEVSGTAPCCCGASERELLESWTWLTRICGALKTTTPGPVIRAGIRGKTLPGPLIYSRTPQERSGFLHDWPRKLAGVSGQASQSFNVYNEDVATPQFHGPRVLQPGERPGDRLSFDPDHCPELSMREASGYL